MTIQFNCEHCGQEFTVHDEVGGKHGRCRVCNGKMKIPTATPPKKQDQNLEDSTYQLQEQAVVHVENEEGQSIGEETVEPGGVDRFMDEAQQIIYLYGGATPDCLMRLSSLAERYGMDSDQMNTAVAAIAKGENAQDNSDQTEATPDQKDSANQPKRKSKRLIAFGKAVQANVRGNMMTESMVEELALIGTLRHGLGDQQVRDEIAHALEVAGAKVIDETAAIAYMKNVVNELMEDEMYVSDDLRERFYKLGNEVGLAHFLIDELVLEQFNPVRLSKKIYREVGLILALVTVGVLLVILIFSDTWGPDQTNQPDTNLSSEFVDPFQAGARPTVHREALTEEQWPTTMIRFDVESYAKLAGGLEPWANSLLQDDPAGRAATAYPGMWNAVDKTLAQQNQAERQKRLTLLAAHVYITEPDQKLVDNFLARLINILATAVEPSPNNPSSMDTQTWHRIYGQAFWAVEVCAVVMTDDIVSPSRTTQLAKQAGRYLNRVVYEPREKSEQVNQRMAIALAQALAQNIVDSASQGNGSGAAISLVRFEGLAPYLRQHLGPDQYVQFENKLARVVLDAKTLEAIPLDNNLIGALKHTDVQNQLNQILEAYGGATQNPQSTDNVSQLTQLLGRLLGQGLTQIPQNTQSQNSTTPAKPTTPSNPPPSNPRPTAIDSQGRLLSLAGDARRASARLTTDSNDVERLLEEAVVMAHVSMGLIAHRENHPIDNSLARAMGLKDTGSSKPLTGAVSQDRSERMRQLAAVLSVTGKSLQRDRLAALQLIANAQGTTSIQPVAHEIARYLLTTPYQEYAAARQSIFKFQSSANLMSAFADLIGSIKNVTKERVGRLLMSVAGTQGSLKNNWTRESQTIFRRQALTLIENGHALGPNAKTPSNADSVLDWHDLLADIYYEQATITGVADSFLNASTAPAVMLNAMINDQLKKLRRTQLSNLHVRQKLDWVTRLHEIDAATNTIQANQDSVSGFVNKQRLWAGILEVQLWINHPQRGPQAEQYLNQMDEKNASARTLIEQMRNSEQTIMSLWVLRAGG